MSGIASFGDRALRFALPEGTDRRALLARLRSLPGVTDVVLAETVGAVLATSPAEVAGAVAAALALPPESLVGPPPVEHAIEVAYDGADLEEVARTLALAPDALVALHAAPTYDVALVGFQPGFAYLRGLDPGLVLPRRASPRPRVPARSVAVAAGYTGIYPQASPGGWHLLGEALSFVPFTAAGARLALGDRVRFVPAARDVTPPAAAGAERAEEPVETHLEVTAARGPALLVDAGRTGHMHEGVPHGGPLVRGAFARANEAAGNAPGACGIEIYGDLELLAHADVCLADDTGARHVLARGASLRLGTDGRSRVRYLAVSGGIDARLVLGSRGALLGAGLGGLAARGLRRGDRVAVGGVAASATTAVVAAARADAPIVLRRGPDATDEELAAIARGTFAVSPTSDRTGSRLDGPPLPARPHVTERVSVPMVRGAIERTPSGLVVLGPDHPTTGGYPVVAVVAEASQDAFFGRLPGAPSRFVLET
ncbi:MAG: Allophanate hydrolase 2 subunit 1 [Labilithrix sp.]|nr:Allophanate hydrolase 2 subunit 1 [Labilithrix sp.]